MSDRDGNHRATSTQRLLQQYTAVNRLLGALGELGDLQAVYHTIYEHVAGLMDAGAFIVSLFDPESRLIHAAYVITDGQERDVGRFPPIPLEEEGHGTQSRVIRSGRPLRIDNWRQAMERTRTEYAIADNGTVTPGPPPPEEQAESTNSALLVPLKIEGNVIGVLQVQSTRLAAYDEADEELLGALANVAALAIHNARLYEQARREVAERRQVEEALQEREARLRHFVEASQEGIFLHEEGVILDVNEAGAAMFGYTPFELIGRNVLELTHPDSRKLVEAKLREHAEEPYELVGLRKDGTSFPIESRPRNISYRGRQVRAAVIRDLTEQKRAEEELRSLLRFQQEMLDTAAIWINTLDAEGNVTFWNRAAEQISGYGREEVLGHAHIWEWLYPDPDYRAWVFDTAKQIIEQGRRETGFETTILCKDGRRKVIAWYSNRLQDENGRVVGSIALGADVTERRQTEEALRESEARQRSIIEHLSDGVVVTDEEGIVRIWNRSLEEITGVPAEEVIGRTVWDFQFKVLPVPERTVERYEELKTRFLKYLENGQMPGKREHAVHRFRRPDGTEVLVELTTFAIPTRQGYLLAAVARDVTERQKMEEALRESEERYRLLVDSSPYGIGVHQDGKVVFANQAAARLLGAEDPSQLIGKPIQEIVHPEGWEAARDRIQRMLQGEKGLYPVEDWYVRLDGTRVPVEVIAAPFTFKGRPAIQVIAQDISERKRAQEELQRYQQHLEELVAERTAALEAANRELEAFAYSVSHDLRAPLRHIAVWSQALEEEYGETLDSQARVYLERVRQQTAYMQELVDAMLSLSRLTRGEMLRTTVNLSEMAKSIVRRLREETPEREVEVSIQEDVEAWGDARLLEAALSNLLGNAWKFTRDRRPARIEFGVMQEEGRQVYYVRDNGVGFDMQYASRLFSPFRRLHSEEEFPGTGVGLATVQRIVHRHGGRIWVEAEVDKGATFYFTLRGSAGHADAAGR